MVSHRNWLPLFVIAALAFGCNSEPAAEEGTAEETIVVDAAAIEAAIDAANTQFETAVAANDTIAIANLYAEDAIILPPNMPRGEGRDGVRGTFASLLAPSPNPTLTLDTDKVIVAESGELATEIGRFAVSGTAPDGTEWQESGKNIRLWKNVDGTWQIVADAWNSDTPMPGAMPAEGGV
jgi:uncharacterized protein (TIGR02246 family)